MVQQVHTAEIWGKERLGGGLPAVKAFYGPLPQGADGIEFETSLPPTTGVPRIGQTHSWYASSGHAAVARDPAYAAIPVRVRHVRYLGQKELASGVDLAF